MIIRRLKKCSMYNPSIYNYALTEYLYKELKKNNVKCMKKVSYIHIDLNNNIEDKYNKMIVDCFNGNIYLRGNGYKDKKIGNLARFGGSRESDAMYCAIGGAKKCMKILEKINTQNNLQVEGGEKIEALSIYPRLKKMARLLFKDLRKIAWHDEKDRTGALVWIDGKIYVNTTHGECINAYLKDKDGSSLSETQIRPNVNLDPEDAWDDSQKQDLLNIQNNANQIVFGHIDSKNKMIYIEPDGMNISLEDIKNVCKDIKNEYQDYKIVLDNATNENFEQVAKINHRLKKVLYSNLIDMRKIARHDIEFRECAVCYIDGEFIEASRHSECIDKYLKEHSNDSLNDSQYRPYQFEPNYNEYGITDNQKKDMETIKNNINKIAFAHKIEDKIYTYDEPPYTIYIEEASLQNMTLDEAAKVFKEHYPKYHIYSDEDYDNGEYNEIASKKSRLKKIANSSDLAIAIINGEIYTGSMHGQAITQFLKRNGISDDIELYNRDEYKDIFGDNFAYQFAFADLYGKDIYIEEDTLQNITLEQAAEILKEKYPDCDIYSEINGKPGDKIMANDNISRLKKIAYSNLIDMRKIAIHDINDRDCAICYVNGEIIEGETHGKCINKYLEQQGENLISDDYYRPALNEEEADSISDVKNADIIKDNINELAFAHKKGNDIFVESKTLIGLDIYAAAEIFKDKYPECDIYDDDVYYKKDKEYQKVANKRLAYYEEGNRECAIVLLNDTFIESNNHWDAIKQYFANNLKITDEDKIEQILDDYDFAHDKTYIKTYAMAVKLKNKIIYILKESINDLNPNEMKLKFQQQYPGYDIKFDTIENMDDNSGPNEEDQEDIDDWLAQYASINNKGVFGMIKKESRLKKIIANDLNDLLYKAKECLVGMTNQQVKNEILSAADKYDVNNANGDINPATLCSNYLNNSSLRELLNQNDVNKIESAQKYFNLYMNELIK